MKKIDLRLASYQISDRTLYIKAAKKHDAVTEIEELYDTYYSMQTGLKIINQACVRAGSTYVGRAQAMKKIFNINYNPPIPIDPSRDLYAFATLSPHQENSIWVITKNIIEIQHSSKFSFIFFKNNKLLRVPLSKPRMDRFCSNLYKYNLFFKSNDSL